MILSAQRALRASLLCVSLSVLGAAPLGTQSGQALPRYEAPKGASGVSGSIRLGGSSSGCGMLARAAEAFQTTGASVTLEARGSDSAAGASALAEGTIELAAMSRPMTSAERAKVESERGAAPTEIVVALEAVAIYVHKDNPIRGLSVTDVASLFGNGAGGAATARKWSDLGAASGIGPDLGAQTIAAFGVRADSASSTLLRERALTGGAGFRTDLNVQRVPTGVLSGVGSNKAGVGYASPSFRSSQAVRLVPVGTSAAAGVEPTQDTLLNGSYPLGGKLYVYVVTKAPRGGGAGPAALEFLRFMLSREGQEAAVKEGSLALPASVVVAERQKLGG